MAFKMQLEFSSKFDIKTFNIIGNDLDILSALSFIPSKKGTKDKAISRL